ncbi:MAG: hypothetical protein WBX15_17045 [Thermoanaerobaculia bacterium]
MTSLIIVDNWGLSDTTSAGRISEHIPGPAVTDSGLLSRGGTIYVIWLATMVTYLVALWIAPTISSKAISVKRILLRVLGSALLLTLIGVDIFLLLLPG